MSEKEVFVLADGRRSSDCFCDSVSFAIPERPNECFDCLVILEVSAVSQFQNVKTKVLIVS
jgi:hypothetical protein